MDWHDISWLSPLVGALALGSLGTVALLSGRREAAWKLFSLFCFTLAIACGFALVASNTEDPQLRLVLMRAAPVLAFASFGFAILYVAELSELHIRLDALGYELNFSHDPQRRRFTLFGLRTSLLGLVLGMSIAWLSLLVLSSTTELLLRDARLLPNGGTLLTHGPLAYVALVMLSVGLVKINVVWCGALRRARDPAVREFYWLNFLAFNLIYVPAMTLNLILTALGHHTEPLAFLGFPFAVLVFFVAIVRYQFARVDELTQGLEAKVAERTDELRRAHAQLLQSEKLASLGRLVAGVAHELNNPAGAVSAMQQNLVAATRRLEPLVNQLPHDESRATLRRLLAVLADAAAVIGAGSQRIASVVARLKSFARLDEAQHAAVDITAGLKDAVELLRYELADDICVESHFATLPALHCDPRALNQAWLNLLLNAAQSFDGTSRREKRIVLKTERAADSILVHVTDNGRGIPIEELEKVFDPGFTTKGVRVGTGLGLPISYQIVEDHGGRLELTSVPGQGTCATVRLPLRAGAAP